MKLIELHILQSFPVTCLNRDDIGSPKSALFGGVLRARVSSQSWKRAIRLMASELQPELFAGKRTHYIVDLFRDALKAKGASEEDASKYALVLAESLNTIDKKRERAVKTLMFFSPGEIADMSGAFLDGLKDLAGGKKDRKALDKLVKAAHKSLGKGKQARDMADIAIFGRMVSDDQSLTVEGAGMFSHALSTHRADNEIDFFSAVDDVLPEDQEGAGHIGTIEYNSACYYRYIALNLDLLWDPFHLSGLEKKEIDTVLDSFIRASILAVPGARKNSMMGFAPPAYVLGLVRTGQPLSLANAFEEPVPEGKGYVGESIARLEQHLKEVGEAYGIEADVSARIPELKLEDFIGRLIKDA